MGSELEILDFLDSHNTALSPRRAIHDRSTKRNPDEPVFCNDKFIWKQYHFHSWYLVAHAEVHLSSLFLRTQQQCAMCNVQCALSICNVQNPLVLIAVKWTSSNLQIILWQLLGILNCRGLVLTWGSVILRMLDVFSITILWVLTAFHIESYTIHLLWSGAFYEALTKKQPLCCFHQPYCCKSIFWTCSNPLLEKKSFNTKACNILT